MSLKLTTCILMIGEKLTPPTKTVVVEEVKAQKLKYPSRLDQFGTRSLRLGCLLFNLNLKRHLCLKGFHNEDIKLTN